MATPDEVLTIFKDKLSMHFDIITVSKNLNNTCILNFRNSTNDFEYRRILNLDFNDTDINKITENILMLIKYK